MTHPDPTAINVQTDADTHRIKGRAAANGEYFDLPAWSFIDKNLWVGGYLPMKLPAHFRHVISLYPWEKYRQSRQLETEMYVALYDSQDDPVNIAQIDAIARVVNAARVEGPTLVHCQCGINRSNLVVARALWLMNDPDFDTGEKIVKYLRAARGDIVLCNSAFEAEVLSWKRSRRWITVGWCKSAPYETDEEGRHEAVGPLQAVMNLNGRPRAYYDLKQAQRALPHLSTSARIAQLDFTEEGITGEWV